MNFSILTETGLCVPWVQTMLHFLWQGLVIAALAEAVARCLPRTAARWRYLVYFAALVLMAGCVPVTFGVLHWRGSGAVATVQTFQREVDTVSTLAPAVESASLDTRPRELLPASTRAAEMDMPSVSPAPTDEPAPDEASAVVHFDWRAYTPYLTAAYLLGVVVMLVRLLLALGGGSRLRRCARPVDDPDLLETVKRQARLLGLRFLPVVAYCERVAVPAVVGIVRPMILLPVSFCTGLLPDQVQAILTHELAHIRRYDHLVNLLQRFIEAVFYFHPAVWYISRRLSAERENICDDLVVAMGQQRVHYAESLLRMAELSVAIHAKSRSATPLALGAAGSPSRLRKRILRLIGGDSHEKVRLSQSWPLALVLVAAAVLTTSLFVHAAAEPAGKEKIAAAPSDPEDNTAPTIAEPGADEPASPAPAGTQPGAQRKFQDALIFVNNHRYGPSNGAKGTLKAIGRIACGHPGAVSEVAWKFLESTPEGDSYEVVRRFPVDRVDPDNSDQATVSKKKIVYRGFSITVFEDDVQRIVVMPAKSSAAQPGTQSRIEDGLPARIAVLLDELQLTPAREATLRRWLEEADVREWLRKQASERIDPAALAEFLKTSPRRFFDKGDLGILTRLRAAAGWGEPISGLRCRWAMADQEVAVGTAPKVRLEVENISRAPLIWNCGVFSTVLLTVSEITDGTYSRFRIELGQGAYLATWREVREWEKSRLPEWLRGDETLVARWPPLKDAEPVYGFVRLAPKGRLTMVCYLPYYQFKKAGTYRVQCCLVRDSEVYLKSMSGTTSYAEKNELTCPPLVLQAVDAPPAAKEPSPRLSIAIAPDRAAFEAGNEVTVMATIRNLTSGELDGLLTFSSARIVLDGKEYTWGPKIGLWEGPANIRPMSDLRTAMKLSEYVSFKDDLRPGDHKVFVKIGDDQSNELTIKIRPVTDAAAPPATQSGTATSQARDAVPPRAQPAEADLVVNAADTSIVWGKPEGGLRAGLQLFRPVAVKELGRSPKPQIRIGDVAGFHVVVENVSSETIQVDSDYFRGAISIRDAAGRRVEVGAPFHEGDGLGGSMSQRLSPGKEADIPVALESCVFAPCFPIYCDRQQTTWASVGPGKYRISATAGITAGNLRTGELELEILPPDKDELSDRVATALKKGIDQFTLKVVAMTDQQMGLRSLRLMTFKPKGKYPDSWSTAVMDRKQAEAVIRHLAEAGHLWRSVAEAYDEKRFVEPSYFLGVSLGDESSLSSTTETGSIPLDWGPSTQRKLKDLKEVLTGDAAQAMDELLKRLEPHRKQWEKAAPSLERDTPAEPKTVEVKVPKSLTFVSDNGRLAWNYSEKDLAVVPLRVRPGFNLAYRLYRHLFLDDKPLTTGDGLAAEGGYEGRMPPDRGNVPVPSAASNRVLAGGKLKVVADLEIIEDSAPGRQGWRPVGPVVHKVHLEGVATKDTVAGLAQLPEEIWGDAVDGLRTRLAFVGSAEDLFLNLRNVSDKEIALDGLEQFKDPWQFLHVRRDNKTDVPVRKSPAPAVEKQRLGPGHLTEVSTVELAGIVDFAPGLYTLQWSIPADNVLGGKRVPPPSNMLYLKVSEGRDGKLVVTELPPPQETAATAPSTTKPAHMPISWGQAKDGTVCGISLDRPRYRMGEKVTLSVYLKNTGPKAVACNVSGIVSYRQEEGVRRFEMIVDALGGQYTRGNRHVIEPGQTANVLVQEFGTRPTGNRASDLHFTPGKTPVVVLCAPMFAKIEGPILAPQNPPGIRSGMVTVEVADTESTPPATQPGAAVDGLKCRLEAPAAAVPMGAKVLFKLYPEFDAKAATDPKVNLLNRCDRAWTVSVAFVNTKTRQVYVRSRCDAGMPPGGPDLDSLAVLRGKPLKPVTFDIRLLADNGEQIPAGAYRVTATYENIAEPQVEAFTRPDGLLTTRPYTGPWKFWKGSITSAPIPLRIDKAEPEELELKVNSTLTAQLENGRVGWGWGKDNPTQITVKRRPGYTLGTRYRLSAVINGKEYKEHEDFFFYGLSSAVWRDDSGTDYLSDRVAGLIKAGDKVKLVAAIEVFETSLPAGHMWSPEGGDFKVLWKGKAEGRLNPAPGTQPDKESAPAAPPARQSRDTPANRAKTVARLVRSLDAKIAVGSDVPAKWAAIVEASKLVGSRPAGANMTEFQPLVAPLFKHANYGGIGQRESRMAANVLVRIGKPALPLLAEKLKSGDSHNRWSAMDILGRIGEPKQLVIAPARSLLADPDEYAQRKAIEALGRFGKEAKEAVKDLEALVHGKYRFNQVCAQVALIRIEGPSDARIKALAGYLKSQDNESAAKPIACYAAEVLGDLGAPARIALPELLEASNSPDANTRVGAVAAMGRIQTADVKAIATLIDRLKNDTELEVRRTAASALSDIGPPAAAAIPALREALSKGGANEGWWVAEEAIRRIESGAGPADTRQGKKPQAKLLITIDTDGATFQAGKEVTNDHDQEPDRR